MSDSSRGFGASAEPNKVGPDYFGFYTHEVADLFSQDEDFMCLSSQTSELAGRTNGVVGDEDITNHSYNGKEGNGCTGSGSLFCDVMGAKLSDYKKERLKALLQQSVIVFKQEVDEMVDPVESICRIQSRLRYKRSLLSYSGAPCLGEPGQGPRKKLRASSSSLSISTHLHVSPVDCRDSEDECMDVVVPGKGMANGVEKKCAHCHMTEVSKCRTGPEGPKSLCNDCGIKFKRGKESLSIEGKKRESCLGSNIGAEKENEEVDDDLQFLLENDVLKVEGTMKKYSDELSATLRHMEQKLEELLDIVMSYCRLMTYAEKQQLQKFIQKLPPRNLDRIVEIIRRSTLSEKYSSNEIHVDLEEEDNITLWRLYCYVETVESARKLCVAEPNQSRIRTS